MKMKNKIIEICELGQPQSIIHRENEPITELIKTDSLIEELNKQLTIPDVVKSSHCELYDFGRQDKTCEKKCDSCKWMERQ